jgi:hypothetical protein
MIHDDREGNWLIYTGKHHTPNSVLLIKSKIAPMGLRLNPGVGPLMNRPISRIKQEDNSKAKKTPCLSVYPLVSGSQVALQR